MNLRPATEDRLPPVKKRPCREQATLACVGLRAALRRRSRRQRLRADLLAAMADKLARE